jgi:hypothetical protein
MDPAIIFLGSLMLAAFSVGTPILVRTLKDFDKKMNACHDKQIVTETKLDIFLAHSGFDIAKVNSQIKSHKDALKANDQPSVGGCINLKDMYKEKEQE